MNPPIARSPAWDEAPVWREMLERALGELAASRRLADGLPKRLHDAIGLVERIEATPLHDPCHLENIDALGRALAEMQARLPAGAVARAVRSVEKASRRCRALCLSLLAAAPVRAVPKRQRPPPRFTASAGVPVLHDLPREPMVAPAPAFDFDRAWTEVEREGPDDAPLDEQIPLPLPGGSMVLLRRLARDYLDEIGAMGMLRQARGNALHHASIARFERRLLESLDALAALAHGRDASERIDVLHEVQRYVAEAFVPDPWRAFAAAFVLGCARGTEGVRAAVAALRISHPDTHDAQLDALSLCPNPEVDAALRRICDEGDAAWLERALRVQRFRRSVDLGASVVLLGHPRASVRREAARALGRAQPRPAAVSALEHALADEREEEVALAIVEALAHHGAPASVRWLQHETTPSRLRLLALLGGRRDGERIARLAANDAGYAEALGWYGSVPLLGAFVETLDGSDARVRRAAERALWRVLGVVVQDDTPEALRRAYAAAPPLDAAKKHRFGRPFCIASLVEELAQPRSSGDEREACALELAALTAGEMSVEPHDWVSRQHAILAGTLGPAKEPRPGAWLGDSLRARSG